MSTALEWEEMTDEEEKQLARELADPSLIVAFDRCMEIIEVLDGEIAGIEGQLEAARAEASVAQLSPDRQAWLRRAAAAFSFKKSQRSRVWMRGKELRGTKGPAQTPRKDPAEKVAKQDRLKAEAEMRKAKRQADGAATQLRLLEIAAAASWRKHFVSIANERMSQADFQQWVDEAKKRAAPAVS